jgi:hypothetical protein
MRMVGASRDRSFEQASPWAADAATARMAHLLLLALLLGLTASRAALSRGSVRGLPDVMIHPDDQKRSSH